MLRGKQNKKKQKQKNKKHTSHSTINVLSLQQNWKVLMLASFSVIITCIRYFKVFTKQHMA